nr:histidine kinase dimerization/phospho-acceptor domain-containing protein [Verrucomicrobiae bacterium]
MQNANPANDPELLAAFRTYEQQTRIQNTKVGCFLVVTLMPAGSTLDWFVYKEHTLSFFLLRLACSALAGLIWGMLYTPAGRRLGQVFGVVVPLLPVIFIALMIAQTQGFMSPYYAGLNLVLLAVGAVLRWTFVESVVAVVLVFLIYVAAGVWHYFHHPLDHGITGNLLFNNFYFLTLMDIIVVVGTFFQYRQRMREFSLRFALDKSRADLEQTNQKLVEMDQVKSRFFANISHELRTPLTLLIAPLESLWAQRGSRVDEGERELLRTMQANGMRLLRLINDLLDLVRLESGRMEIKREPVVMGEFARGMATAVGKVAQDKHLRLETVVDENAGTVMADRDKLEKVVLNLLFNAIKFTAAGS